MKARVLAPDFATATKQAAKFKATRTTLPITNHVLLETADGELWLTATDLETTITLKIRAQVDEPGALAVPAELLAEMAGRADSEVVGLSTPDDNPRTMLIDYGRQSARISGLDSEDFPPVPGHFTMATAFVDSYQFRENLKQVLVNVDKKRDWQPALECVQFNMSHEQVTMTAADGFRLGVRRVSAFDNTIGNTSFLVHHQTLDKLLRLLPTPRKSKRGNPESWVYIALSTSHVAFSIDSAIVIGTLSNANAPDYGAIIPESADTDIMISRDDLLQAVKVASPFARLDSGIIRLTAKPGEHELRVSAKFEGGEVAGRIPASIVFQAMPASRYISDNLPEPICERPQVNTAFNGAFLAGYLGKLATDGLCLGVSGSESAALFTPMIGQSMDLESQTAIMPMISDNGREKLPAFNAWGVDPRALPCESCRSYSCPKGYHEPDGMHTDPITCTRYIAKYPEPITEPVETAEVSAVC